MDEAIAVVQFGGREDVVLHMTNDYNAARYVRRLRFRTFRFSVLTLASGVVHPRRAINGLDATGGTPMEQGLLNALKEMLERGHIVRLGTGCALTPRIVLMTDGKPTDPAGEDVAKRKVSVVHLSRWLMVVLAT